MAQGGKTDFGDFYDYQRSKQLIENVERDVLDLEQVFSRFTKSINKFNSQFKKSLQDTTNTIKGNNQAIKALDKTQMEAVDAIIKYTKENEKLNKEGKETKATIQSIDQVIKNASKSVNGQKELIKQLTAEFNRLDPTVAKESKRLQELSKALITARNHVREMSNATRTTNNILNRTTGSYNALTAAIKQDVDALKNIPGALQRGSAAYKQNAKEIQTLQTRIRQNTAALKAFDAQMGRSFRNVGNYQSALAGLGRQFAAAFGFTGTIFLLANAIRNAGETIIDFQRENAVLAGVLDTTREEISALTDDSLRLGATTAKTASDVTQLQIAYARLGFTQQEILDLTGDTINGSIALNAELAETAELTGAVVRTFDDLATTDADVILDQMTAATQRSALNFSKLQTAIPIVAGAANAAGISFTRVLAILGKLSDAGIDASMSATALRNIFIESAAQGLSYEEILVKISNSQDKLTAANDEFGKRAAVSATILSNLVEETGELDKELQNAGGTAKRVADEQLATLAGEIKILQSAYEGLILSIESGDGVISEALSGFIEAITKSLNVLTMLNEGAIGFFDVLSIAANPVNYLTVAMEKNTAAAIKNAKAFNLETEALEIFEIAQRDGIKSFEDFAAVQAEFVHASRDPEERLKILQMVLDLYDKEAQKSTDSTKELNDEFENQLGILDVLNRRLKQLGKEREEATSIDAILRIDRETKAIRSQIKAIDDLVNVIDDAQKRLSEGIELNPQEILDDIRGSELGDIDGVLDLILNGGDADKATDEFKRALKDASDASALFFAEMEQKAERTSMALEFLGDSIGSIGDIASNISERQIQEQDAVLEAIRNRYQQEIDAAEGNEGKQKQLRQQQLQEEKAVQREIAKQQQKQAEFAKLIRISQIISEAAQRIFQLTAMAKVLSVVPVVGPFLAANALRQIPFIIGGSLLATAAVASEPVPQIPAFAEGTENAPGGPAIVNDAPRQGGKVKRELISTPTGKKFFFDSDKPVLTDKIPKGSKIDPRDVSELTDVSNILKDYSPVVGQHSELFKSFENKVSEVTINQTQSIDYDKLGEVIARNMPELQQIIFEEGGKVKKAIIKGSTKRITARFDPFKNSELEKQVKNISKKLGL